MRNNGQRKSRLVHEKEPLGRDQVLPNGEERKKGRSKLASRTLFQIAISKHQGAGWPHNINQQITHSKWKQENERLGEKIEYQSCWQYSTRSICWHATPQSSGSLLQTAFPNQQVQVILGETTGGGQEGVKESEEEANPHQSFPQLTEQLQNSIAGLCIRLFGQVWWMSRVPRMRKKFLGKVPAQKKGKLEEKMQITEC